METRAEHILVGDKIIPASGLVSKVETITREGHMIRLTVTDKHSAYGKAEDVVTHPETLWKITR